MSNKKKLFSASFVFTLVGICCFFCFTSWNTTHLSSVDQYKDWLNNVDNKCLVSHNIAGVKIAVKFQPALYIVLKDLANRNVASGQRNHTIDSLVKRHSKTLTFLMTVAPDEQAAPEQRGSSIMTQGITNYSDYVKRVFSTNFFMDEYISLYVDGTKYKPALCLLENVYELSDSRTFTVVFASEEAGKDITKGSDIVFEYTDEVFQMGKVQFGFLGKNLSKANDLVVASK